jgi:hypothetical protein
MLLSSVENSPVRVITWTIESLHRDELVELPSELPPAESTAGGRWTSSCARIGSPEMTIRIINTKFFIEVYLVISRK